jgi:TolB-like protein/DNA-binding winged helix-turn-helix (wHTH) protein/Tfp pilus assembly protein PilF
MKQDPAPSKARFAGFEVDLRTGDLHKNGRRHRIQAQPLKALRVLLENSGELVTRDELRKQVWPQETFVDFDHGLNKSIAKLREALDETDSDSSLIETIPRHGYRFVAPVDWGPQPHPPSPEPSAIQPINTTVIRPRRLPWKFVAVTLVIVAAAAFFLVRRIQQSNSSIAVTSIAVLPLENLSGDKNQDYFADGMTDELITMLAQNSSLRVISRTSVMQYKGVHRPVKEIARSLGVDAVIEGTVLRTGETVRVTTQLIYAPTDTHLWAESYVRDVKDVFALQREVAETVAARVNAQPASTPSPRQMKAIKPEAYDAYLHGRYYWFAERQLDKTRDYFRQAVTLQPDYAAAWSGLADITMVTAIYGDSDPSTVRVESERLARKALELDDSLAEGHNSLAAILLFFDWDFKAADQELQRAIALNPNFAEAHHLRSYALQGMNRFDEAIDEAKKAIALDPGARPWGLAYAYILSHRYDDALNEVRLRLEAHPDNAGLHLLLSNIYYFKGLDRECVTEMKEGLRLQHDNAQIEVVKKLYASGGLHAIFVNDLIETEREAKQKYVSPHTLARKFAALGDKDQTMKYLEEALRVRTPRLIRVHIDPEFYFLHSDPRFIELANKVGLTVPK